MLQPFSSDFWVKAVMVDEATAGTHCAEHVASSWTSIELVEPRMEFWHAYVEQLDIAAIVLWHALLSWHEISCLAH